MKSVGKFYQYNSDILRHRQEHLSQILCLNLYLVRRHLELCQLCYAVHKKGYLLGELRGYLLGCHDRILHNIMEYSGNYGLLVQLKLRQYDRHVKRMHDIRLSRLSELSLVGCVSDLVRLLYHGYISRWVICEDPCYELLVKVLRRSKVGRCRQIYLPLCARLLVILLIDLHKLILRNSLSCGKCLLYSCYTLLRSLLRRDHAGFGCLLSLFCHYIVLYIIQCLTHTITTLPIFVILSRSFSLKLHN